MIRLTLYIDPRGKGRPRFGRSRSGHPVAYTDAKTRDYEASIMERAGDQMVDNGLDVLPAGTAVGVRLDAYFKIPKSWPKAKREAAHHHRQKPDADNVAKSFLDAVQDVCWEGGDEAVSYLWVRKFWTDDRPRLEATIFDAAKEPPHE